MKGEFSVYQTFVDGQREDMRFVDAETAARVALGWSISVGAQIGTTVEVMVTDGGDYCNYHWKRDEGILFPEEQKGAFKLGRKNDHGR